MKKVLFWACALFFVSGMAGHGFLMDAKSPAKVGIVAHRGYWNCDKAGYAHNSIAALACAQEAGFWGSEFDVNITSDGVLLVYHDETIDGKLIADHPYDDFKDVKITNGETIPTLEQYLAQGKKSKKTVLVCELKIQPSAAKEDELLDKTVEALKAYGLYNPKRVMFISFSRHICDRIAKEMPKFTNQYLHEHYSPDNLASTGINGIDFHYTWFTKYPDWYQQARNHEMSVNCWTVNGENDMKSMIDLGVDYITTDRPDVLRNLLGEGECRK